ncbi:YebC/PmpR family DNA-binding transcriptional regulator [bacterium]|nr:YebC/PmpR family DNA-binding transcriptional regulator [bacterium]
MSGHSKWATIRRKKEKTDAERGRVFTRIIKELTVAARMDGGDVEGNPRLRTAVSAAKEANMPQSNIERAIKKGTGELPGVTYEEVTYEGYGPGGVAVMIEAVTDNKNRTVSDIRHMFSKRGGSLGENGSVAWMFDRKGVITLDPKGLSEDNIMEIALEAGAEDLKIEDDEYEIITNPEDFNRVLEAINQGPLEVVESELSMIPKNYIKVEADSAKRLMKMIEDFESHDDVQKIHSNFDIDEELMKEIAE